MTIEERVCGHCGTCDECVKRQSLSYKQGYDDAKQEIKKIIEDEIDRLWKKKQTREKCKDKMCSGRKHPKCREYRLKIYACKDLLSKIS